MLPSKQTQPAIDRIAPQAYRLEQQRRERLAGQMARTPVALYRNGNASNARLDALRNADVVIHTMVGDPEIRVRGPNSTGVSCWDDESHLVSLGGRAWRLPEHSRYDGARLLLWPDTDDPGHWNWTPARDMPGSEFLEALRNVNRQFVTV